MDEKRIIELFDEGKSTYEIAEIFGTYANKIGRILKKHGRSRDKSEAQKLAIESGRNKHPTKGRKRTKEEKEKISESRYQAWQNITPEKRAEFVEKCKEQWHNMSDAEKGAMQEAAIKGVHRASKEGSNLERYLLSELTSLGYNIVFHKKGLIENDDLEIDLFIPSLRAAIEIDGPAHFFPIWGQESLEKHIRADAKKTGLLLANGLVVIRIKHLRRRASDKHKRDVLAGLVEVLKSLENKFPEKDKRYIEMEIA